MEHQPKKAQLALTSFLPSHFLGYQRVCAYSQRLGPFCALAAAAPPPSFGIITDDRTVYLYGGPTELLSAREAATGDLLWEKKGLANSLVVPHGVIYAQTGDLKRLTALQARDGKTLWTSSQAVASLPSAPYSLAHSPVVVTGLQKK